MILLIDNYDSFVYNLARYFVELGCETHVVRNDRTTVAQVRDMRPEAIVLSPGPCTPRDAGVSTALVRELAGTIPMLGVCLGHQAIAEAFGGRIIRSSEPVHGRTSLIEHCAERLFTNLPNPLRATRYHSLIVEDTTLPSELVVTARTSDGLIMAVEHATLPIFGVQFHPEAVLTQFGRELLMNFLALSGLTATATSTEELPAVIADARFTSEPAPSMPVLPW